MHVANDASSFFGFVNPFGWFGPSAPSTAVMVKLPAKRLPTKPQAEHRGSGTLPRAPNGSRSFKNEVRVITRSVGSRSGSPTVSTIPMRIIMSECEIKYACRAWG